VRYLFRFNCLGHSIMVKTFLFRTSNFNLIFFKLSRKLVDQFEYEVCTVLIYFFLFSILVNREIELCRFHILSNEN
jgi:hypothetical protein